MATELFPAGAPDVLYLVDLSSYVLRAYHAIAPLSSPSGELTQAVHGTVSMLERLLRERRPMLFAAALDSGRETFRKDIFPGYKANRPPSPEDLCRQLERCEQVVRAFNVAVLKQDGVEADDLIASCVREARAKGIRVVIVAADKDLMQLVGSDVVLYDTMRDRVFGVPEVEERFGVRVDQVRDWLALTGDSSDNIPGVPSVGPKTAKELLNTYGTLEQIYQNLEQIQRKALREALTNNREQAFMSQRLVSLKEDCPCAFDLIKFQRPERDIPVLKQLYAELGFHRQLAALESESAPAARPSPESVITPVPEAPPTVDVVPVSEYSLVTDIAELRALLERGAPSGR
ncbi:MAG TPA: 5'-3' exonuclease H3TH domain-containing protein, partial [Polyangiaceae bacterium]|nr:5'-3' exonuclease H3TH domain-containing protein [Polyangiaceae bacterium]